MIYYFSPFCFSQEIFSSYTSCHLLVNFFLSIKSATSSSTKWMKQNFFWMNPFSLWFCFFLCIRPNSSPIITFLLGKPNDSINHLSASFLFATTLPFTYWNYHYISSPSFPLITSKTFETEIISHLAIKIIEILITFTCWRRPEFPWAHNYHLSIDRTRSNR